MEEQNTAGEEVLNEQGKEADVLMGLAKSVGEVDVGTRHPFKGLIHFALTGVWC